MSPPPRASGDEAVADLDDALLRRPEAADRADDEPVAPADDVARGPRVGAGGHHPDGVEVVLARVALGPPARRSPARIAAASSDVTGTSLASRVSIGPGPIGCAGASVRTQCRSTPVPLVLEDAAARGDGPRRRRVGRVARHEDGVDPAGRGEAQRETQRGAGDPLAPDSRRHGIPDVPTLGDEGRGERVAHRDGADDATVADDPPVRRRHPALGKGLVGPLHPAEPVDPLLEGLAVAQQLAVARSGSSSRGWSRRRSRRPSPTTSRTGRRWGARARSPSDPRHTTVRAGPPRFGRGRTP